MSDEAKIAAGPFTDFANYAAEVDRLSRELDITNADHIALWLEENMDARSIGWVACRIAEAHEAAVKAYLEAKDSTV